MRNEPFDHLTWEWPPGREAWEHAMALHECVAPMLAGHLVVEGDHHFALRPKLAERAAAVLTDAFAKAFGEQPTEIHGVLYTDRVESAIHLPRRDWTNGSACVCRGDDAAGQGRVLCTDRDGSCPLKYRGVCPAGAVWRLVLSMPALPMVGSWTLVSANIEALGSVRHALETIRGAAHGALSGLPLAVHVMPLDVGHTLDVTCPLNGDELWERAHMPYEERAGLLRHAI